MTKLSSTSVGRVGGAGISGTAEVGGTVAADCGDAGARGSMLAVTGAGGGCADSAVGDEGESPGLGPGSEGVTSEN